MIEDEAVEFHLVLKSGRDPLDRQTGVTRSAPYRLRLALKQLLRQFGFRCTSVGPAPPPEPPKSKDI